jgi:hypothetical protein
MDKESALTIGSVLIFKHLVVGGYLPRDMSEYERHIAFDVIKVPLRLFGESYAKCPKKKGVR